MQGNILIDSDHNARLTDFGFSHTLSPQNDLTYPSTNAARPGAAMWVAPELLYPQLFPDLMVEAKTEPNLHVDIYSLGSIILFVRRPWRLLRFPLFSYHNNNNNNNTGCVDPFWKIAMEQRGA